MKRNTADTYFKTTSSAFLASAPCTSNPFERDTNVSSPLDRGFCEVPSPCIFTKYVEEISLFTLDLKCCGKQNKYSKYLSGTVSLHKQAKNPACCFMMLSYKGETYFHGKLADVFSRHGQNLKENERKRVMKNNLLRGNNSATIILTLPEANIQLSQLPFLKLIHTPVWNWPARTFLQKKLISLKPA